MAPFATFLTLALAAVAAAVPYQSGEQRLSAHRTPHQHHCQSTPVPFASGHAQPSTGTFHLPKLNSRAGEIGFPGSAGTFFAKRHQPPARRHFVQGVAQASGVAAPTGIAPSVTNIGYNVGPEITPFAAPVGSSSGPEYESLLPGGASTLTEVRTITEGSATRTVTITRTLQYAHATGTISAVSGGSMPTGGVKRSPPVPREWLVERLTPKRNVDDVPRAYALY